MVRSADSLEDNLANGLHDVEVRVFKTLAQSPEGGLDKKLLLRR